MTIIPPKGETENEELLVQRSVGLPKSLWKRLDDLARAKGRRRSEVVRLLLEYAVGQEEANEPKRR